MKESKSTKKNEKRLVEIDNEIKSLKEKLKTVKGTPTEVYTRIVGYFRAVDQWNKGKKEEYKDRREFKVINDMDCTGNCFGCIKINECDKKKEIRFEKEQKVS